MKQSRKICRWRRFFLVGAGFLAAAMAASAGLVAADTVESVRGEIFQGGLLSFELQGVVELRLPDGSIKKLPGDEAQSITIGAS